MRAWVQKRGEFVKNRILNNTPVVRFLFDEMYKQRIHERDFSRRVGVHRDTLRGWRTRCQPRVNDLEACLSYLGYDLIVRKKPKGKS